jgi:SAF domain
LAGWQSMATRIERPAANGRGAGSDVRRPAVRLEPAERRRRSRVSEIVVGVVVVTVFGLGVVLWHASTSSTESALVLERSVRAGEELRADALRTEKVHVGAAVGHVAADEAKRVLGKRATADLPAGTLVSADLFVAQPPVPPGSTVVAAALAPGQFATYQLRPGQAVAAIRTGDKPAGPEGAGAGAVMAHATIFEVRELKDTTGTWIVSLLVPEGDAPAVASAAAAKALSLALVP